MKQIAKNLEKALQSLEKYFSRQSSTGSCTFVALAIYKSDSFDFFMFCIFCVIFLRVLPFFAYESKCCGGKIVTNFGQNSFGPSCPVSIALGVAIC